MSKDSIEYIHEPLGDFKNKYRDAHKQNILKYFDDLVKKSNVDIEANENTIKKLKQKEKALKNIKKRKTKFIVLRTFLIFLICISFLFGLFAVSNLVSGFVDSTNIIILSVGVLVITLSIILIFKKINPKVKDINNLKELTKSKINELANESWKQMEPLNKLFHENMSIELFKKTIPLINFDEVFDRNRMEYMIQKFGYNPKTDNNRSKLYVKSGQINGNPFFLAQDLVHRMGMKTYTGSKVISWRTTRRVNGKVQTVRRTQTLIATVSKPHPYYNNQKYLIYANDAAPDLSFSRNETDVENLTEKQIERMVNKNINKLERKSRKAISTGSSYTVLGHSEFEVLFGATNRDNEVQFRLLFTPLAIQQILALMKEKEYGYGDEFNFIKEKKINYILPKHLKDFNLNINDSYYHSNDINIIKDKFIKYNTEFFRQIYFSFAPLLAIPLYQQNKPHEYIYDGLYDSYLSFYEHENIVNKMNEKEFIHPLSKTKNILKTRVINSKENIDTIEVSAYGYQAIERLDFVLKLGGDGRMHQVPVRWIEYVPVMKNTHVEVKHLEEEKDKTHTEKFREYFDSLKKNNISSNQIYKLNNFVAYIIGDKNKMKEEDL